MSNFLEIGEIVEVVSNPVTVIPDIPLNDSSDNNGWNLFFLIAVIAGGALIYYKLNQHENIDISDKS